MKDKDKTKEQLLDELEQLRQRVSELEQSQTERERAGDALQESEVRYRALFENMRESQERYRSIIEAIEEGYYEVDIRGNFTFVNSSQCKMLGYSREELLGMNYRKYMDKHTAKKTYEVFNEVYRTGRPHKVYDYELIRKDGNKRIVSISVSLIKDAKEQPCGFRGILRDVTDLKRAEEALRIAGAYNRSLIEASLDPLLAITAEGKITDVNVATERATGHSRHELIGTDFSGYFTEPGSAIAAYSEAFENGSVQNSPLEIRHANGHVTPVLYNASVYCDESGHVIGVFAAARDITRLKRAEVALRESEARNRLLVEESPFGIGIVKHGMCADANPALVKVLGFTHPNEVIGKRMDEFVSTEEREWVAQLEKQVLEAEDLQVPIEIRGRKSNGKVFDLSIWPKRIAHMGEPAVLFVADDTTEAKCLKAQLLQAQKMEAVGTLAGGIAHEFNNLLQVISGYAEMLILDRSEGETGYEDVQKIILSAQRGAELVRKLQVFSSKSEIRQGPLNLNRHVEQVKDLLMPTIPKMIEIEVNLANDLDLVNADSGQMEQVLMNLALNAKDAMLEGGKLTIETRNLTLDADYCRLRPEMKPGDYVELTVSDTGIGMDEETLDHIFEPFYTTKGLAYRSGLGLAVVHGIVHQHKGYITCESKPGEGSTFTIYFPAIATNLQSESDLKEAKPAGGTETILLVDDEECIRELASRFLSQSGYRVLTADNGQEALDLYRTEQESVSLVILDLIMPRMSGSQCLEWLLKIDSKARILIASGYSETEKRGELIRAGVKGFVSKPFRMVEMLKAVRDVLDAD